MNMHIKGQPWEEEGQNLMEAVDRLGFITMMVAEWYKVCPHCLSLALAARMEDEMEEADDDGE